MSLERHICRWDGLTGLSMQVKLANTLLEMRLWLRVFGGQVRYSA